MAVHDHTVRTRPSIPSDGTFTAHPADPTSTGTTWPETLRLVTLDDLIPAVFASARRRDDSERYLKAQARGLAAKPQACPLSIAIVGRLGTAIRGLRQYARWLGHEPPVNTSPVR